MTLTDWIFLSCLAVVAVLYLGDAINSTTAAVRELLEVNRRDKP
mgnify:FL=1